MRALQDDLRLVRLCGARTKLGDGRFRHHRPDVVGFRRRGFQRRDQLAFYRDREPAARGEPKDVDQRPNQIISDFSRRHRQPRHKHVPGVDGAQAVEQPVQGRVQRFRREPGKLLRKHKRVGWQRGFHGRDLLRQGLLLCRLGICAFDDHCRRRFEADRFAVGEGCRLSNRVAANFVRDLKQPLASLQRRCFLRRRPRGRDQLQRGTHVTPRGSAAAARLHFERFGPTVVVHDRARLPGLQRTIAGVRLLFVIVHHRHNIAHLQHLVGVGRLRVCRFRTVMLDQQLNHLVVASACERVPNCLVGFHRVHLAHGVPRCRRQRRCGAGSKRRRPKMWYWYIIVVV